MIYQRESELVGRVARLLAKEREDGVSTEAMAERVVNINACGGGRTHGFAK